MLRLLMLRHAQSTWNAQGRWQGHADPPLSAEGKQTAKAVASQYLDISRIISSPLLRAKETAEIIAASNNLGTIATHPGLAERDLGEWEGLTRNEVEEGWPEYLQEHKWPESAETTEAFQKRVLAAISGIAERIEAERIEAEKIETERIEAEKIKAEKIEVNMQDLPGEALIVAHAGVIITLEQSLGEAWRKIGNLCGRAVILNSGEMTLGEKLDFESETPAGLTAELAAELTAK